jgi:hypothetical protein
VAAGDGSHLAAQRGVAGKEQQADLLGGTQAFDRRQVALQDIEDAPRETAACRQLSQCEGRGGRLRAWLEDHRGARQQRRSCLLQRAKQGCAVVADHRHDTAAAGCRGAGRRRAQHL